MKSNSDIFLKNPKVCCISDVHIGVHQNSAQWHNITLEWAKWLASELNKKKIQDIIISGDFFHYRDEIAVNTMHFVTQILDVWREFNIIMLVGNHDAYYKDTSDVNSLSILNGWSNISCIAAPTTTTLFNKKITFCPWGTNLTDIPECDIIFGHFEIQSFKQNSFKICSDGFQANDVLSKANLIISGHFHLRTERKYGKGTILYLGNPFHMDFGDVESIKGYYVLDINKAKYKFTENTISPTHRKIFLSELVKAGKINNQIRQDFDNSFIKLVIDKNISTDEIDILLKKLSSLNPISITVDYAVNFNKYEIDTDSKTDFSGIDIPAAIEEFVGLMDIQNKDQVIEYTNSLYRKCTK